MIRQPGSVSGILAKAARAFCRVKRSEQGTVAIIFALSALPLIGMTALGIEYSRASSMRAAMQQYADASALNATVWRKENKAAAEAGDATAYAGYDPWAGLNETLKQFQYRYPGQISRIEASARWVGEDQFEITMDAVMPPMTWSLIGDMNVGIVSVAKVIPKLKPPEKPQVVFLDSYAYDYNRLYVYCYELPDLDKPKSQWKPAEERRRAFTAISDNAGTNYNYTMPSCEPNETVSVMLHNVTGARSRKSLWDSNPKRYFSDTSYDRKNFNSNTDVQKYSFGGYNMVENIICNTLSECKPKDQGGIIPTGPGRTPAENKTPCSSGKFLYQGFEDRPTGGDRDFNDIRIVMECPRDPEYVQRVVLAR